jgi:hypothetical protein
MPTRILKAIDYTLKSSKIPASKAQKKFRVAIKNIVSPLNQMARSLP